MKIVRLLVFASITIALIGLLNTRMGTIPPLGKFLDPFRGFWQNAETEAKQANLNKAVKGLNAPATVIFDQYMVPHIEAENIHDLFFLQGYVTAMHRLWQMELQTHFAGGRISEIFGEKTLALDRENRRSGMVAGARSMLDLMRRDPETKVILDAYTEGVNAWIDQLEAKDLPLEYKLLDYEPEPWTNLKIALLNMYMSKNLTWGDDDLTNTRFANSYGSDNFDLVFPLFPDTIVPIIPKGTPFPDHLLPPAPDTTILPVITSGHTFEFTPDPSNGSNNWAVSGAKTTTGYPMLANDPHLGLNLPSIWYCIHLKAPGINTMGASLPGGPGIISGFNDSIAWGITNSQRDVKDWYNIRFKDNKQDFYWYDNSWHRTTRVIDTIGVRSGADFYDTVYYTHHGPVVFDRGFQGDSTHCGLALKWLGLEAANPVQTFLRLMRGTNYADFQAAMQRYVCPPQNFVFAAHNGDIAIWQQGAFPDRWYGQGRYVMDGSNPAFDWQGTIAPTENPHVLNPDRGYVSSANQHPTDTTYPYFYTGSFEYYRNRRINEVLQQQAGIDLEKMEALQNDNFNLQAAENLPEWLRHIDVSDLSKKELSAYNTLRDWNHYNNAASKAAPFYEALADTFYMLIWDELQLKEGRMPAPKRFNTWHLVKTQPDNIFFDHQSTAETENAWDLLQWAFHRSVHQVEAWIAESGHFTWAAYKHTRITHLARTLAPFDVAVGNGGGEGIVNATRSDHGPSWRMVVSLEDTVRAMAVYPGGQSGNPGSPYYSDMIPSWSQGHALPLNFTPDDILANQKIRWNLKPSRP